MDILTFLAFIVVAYFIVASVAEITRNNEPVPDILAFFTITFVFTIIGWSFYRVFQFLAEALGKVNLYLSAIL